MADAELIRHQRTWHGFTRFVTISTASVVALLAILAVTLLHH